MTILSLLSERRYSIKEMEDLFAAIKSAKEIRKNNRGNLKVPKEFNINIVADKTFVVKNGGCC
ncbi:hypothetical protein AGMMS49953_00350 [Endomicrobiia bacterium]|nr:hypothetical protein AGMMS49953_00350 [Endomicrobiia bacterium]